MNTTRPRDGVSLGPPLAGRDRVLGELDGEFQRVLTGDFRVVLITGTPGLGKTRLAAKVLQHNLLAEEQLHTVAEHQLGQSRWLVASQHLLPGHRRADYRALKQAVARQVVTMFVGVNNVQHLP
ncbi:ATP-binding protein [Aquisalimonas sp.]|uniref:ATP-binding protein n=1 Tax=Aquisalimonas sp. TaxID=1872621 RepID=UPI0034545290